MARFQGTQIIDIAAAFGSSSATWIVHGTTGTCLRTKHTAFGITLAIYNGGIIIVTGCIIRLQPGTSPIAPPAVVANPPVNPGHDMRVFSTCGNPCRLHPICGNHTQYASCRCAR